MQSTEEYLDQLLASVSDEESGNDANKNSVPKRKSIEDLDESELTEEALQKQLALLLGLEVEEDEEFESNPYEPTPVIEAEPVATVSAPDVQETISVPEPAPASVVTPEPEPAVSNTGVLSADEIAALFASMEAENEAEKQDEIPEVTEPVQEVTAEPEPITTSDSGVLSADEIAALFASMEAENIAENAEESLQTKQSVQEETTESVQTFEGELSGDNGELTREELEELGLGDIADILVDSEQEILSESLFEELMTAEESPADITETEEASADFTEVIENKELPQYEEIPDFNLGEEVLLDLENIDEMLEATAKLAEEESASFDAGAQAEEDIMSMLTQFEEESVQENMAAMEESARAAEQAVAMAMEEEENATELTEEDNGKKKRKKAKKEKVKKEKPVKEKKERKSLKDKVSAFMFEEEEGDENPDDGKVPLGDGDELAYIDMPTEEAAPKKKKEKASKKDKKAKASKKDEKARDENAEIAEELAAEDKKKEKKNKPKKEKKPKKVVISDIEPVEEKKKSKRGIGTKGIVATLLVCASILGLILVGTYFLPQQLSLTAARVAFYGGDYEEAAMRLEGKDLSDSDRIMYEKSSLLYGLEERYHQYEIYRMRGMNKEALNSLLQGVVVCNEELILAEQLGIETEWKMCKDRFVDALLQEYSLDAETVERICELKNPYYTVAVENILTGRAYDDMSLYGGEASATEDDVSTEETTGEENVSLEDGVINPEELEDLLPEEALIIEQLQQENNSGDAADTEDDSNGDRELFTGSVEGGEVNFVE